MSSTPRVSVVIPCYNLGRFLPEALDSVFDQTLQDFEILIVDDGSTDAETRDVLAGLERPGTEVIHCEHRGLPGARNVGIRKARGEYICALDADDCLNSRWLELATELLDRDPDVTFVSHWFRTFGEEQWEWTPERCDLVALLDRNTVNGAALVRRQALLDAGLFDESMVDGCEDWDLWLTLVEQGHRGEIIPRFLFDYRRRRDSMSWAMGERHLNLLRRLIEKHEGSFRTHLLELYQRRELAICDLRRQIQHQEQEVHGWFLPEVERRRNEVTQLRRKVESIRGLATLQDENRELQKSVEGLEQAHENARNEIATLHRSWSWRVTAPLRLIYEQLSRLRGGAK